MKVNSLKVAIIQRHCPHYRIPLFRHINQIDNIDLTVIVNDHQMLKWDKKETAFNLIYLPAISAKFGFGSKNYHIPLSLPLIKHLWQAEYDVIISEGATNIVNNTIIYPLARLRNSRYIWWGAGRRRFAKKNILRRMADPLIHYFIRHADANIAYGSVAHDYMIAVGAAPEKVFIAQNTIDTASISASIDKLAPQVENIRQQLGITNKQIILYVGMIEKRKKAENLILAFQDVVKLSKYPVALVIVGDGPHLPTLKQWYEKELPLLDVHFMGQIIEGVGVYFAMCDVFVLPSEGGLALNQAMAYGKPVIATSADGTEIDLIQQGENGYIVEEDQISELANAIVRVIQNPEKQKAMGRRSAQLMQEIFTLDYMAKSIEVCIRQSADNGV